MKDLLTFPPQPCRQIPGFSLASLVLFIGVAITTSSFYSYFTNGNSITVSISCRCHHLDCFAVALTGHPLTR